MFHGILESKHHSVHQGNSQLKSGEERVVQSAEIVFHVVPLNPSCLVE